MKVHTEWPMVMYRTYSTHMPVCPCLCHGVEGYTPLYEIQMVVLPRSHLQPPFEVGLILRKENVSLHKLHSLCMLCLHVAHSTKVTPYTTQYPLSYLSESYVDNVCQK